MWVFTKNGFVSAVRKNEYREVITIRGRDRLSLEHLSSISGSKIAKSPNGDYPYRLFVAPKIFADWLVEEAMSIDYHNFKSVVAKERGYEFAGPLHDVWAAMLQVEDKDARSGEAEYVDPTN